MTSHAICLLALFAGNPAAGQAPLIDEAGQVVPAAAALRAPLIDQQLWLNEVPTRIREWTLDLDLQASIEFYRRFLGEQHIELKGRGALILAAPHDHRFVTIELRSPSALQTTARVSESDIGAAAAGSNAVPLPPDANVFTRVGSRDGNLNSQTLLARSSADLAASTVFFQNRLPEIGLSLSDRRRLGAGGRSGSLLFFAGAKRRVEVVLTADGNRTWISVISMEPVR